MITKAIAQSLPIGRVLYHISLRNSDGSALRCRVNGKCKVWKTRPDDFQLPVKYGLKTCFYIHPYEAKEWLQIDPTCRYDVTSLVGLTQDAPLCAVLDKLREDGFGNIANIITWK